MISDDPGLTNHTTSFRLPQNAVARRKFFLGTLGMITVPLLAFYFSYNYALNGLIVQFPRGSRLTWSAVISVIAVQVVMIVFITSAMREEDNTRSFSNRERKVLRNELRKQLMHDVNKEPEPVTLFQSKEDKKNQ